MNILHSEVFGRSTRDKQEYERSSQDDHLMVEWDESGRLHDLRFVTALPPSNKVSNDNHTATTFEPPFRGVSVHQGKSIQWMFWNENDFRDLRFHGSEDQIEDTDLWVGSDYEIFKITLYRSWGRIVGFSVSAKLVKNGVEEEEETTEEVSDEASLDEPNNMEETEEDELIDESGGEAITPVEIRHEFFFSDDHIWYIQIALLILASLIIAVALIMGYTQES